MGAEGMRSGATGAAAGSACLSGLALLTRLSLDSQSIQVSSWLSVLRLTGRKVRGMARGALREVSAHTRGRRELCWCWEAPPQPQPSRGQVESWGSQGKHSPLGALASSSPAPRVRQATETGRQEHPTARVSPCPRHPCQVLTKIWKVMFKVMMQWSLRGLTKLQKHALV